METLGSVYFYLDFDMQIIVLKECEMNWSTNPKRISLKKEEKGSKREEGEDGVRLPTL